MGKSARRCPGALTQNTTSNSQPFDSWTLPSGENGGFEERHRSPVRVSGLALFDCKIGTNYLIVEVCVYVSKRKTMLQKGCQKLVCCCKDCHGPSHRFERLFGGTKATR